MLRLRMNRFHSIRVRWGYAELIEAINNPKRDRHAEPNFNSFAVISSASRTQAIDFA